MKKVHPAVLAVWAAVVAAGYLIPPIPVYGTGANFTLANVLIPLSGIFFGPLAGALCSAAGSFIGFLIAPVKPMLGPFAFLIAMTTSFTAGCIAWSRWPFITIKSNGSFVLNGGIIVYLTGTVLWFSQEIGRNAVIFPLVFYGLGFTAMTAGLFFSRSLFNGKNYLFKCAAIWLCAFGGLTGGATVGNFFSIVLFKQPKEFWTALALIAPFERFIFALAAALVGVPLLTGLNKIGIFTGPHFEENPFEQAEEK